MQEENEIDPENQIKRVHIQLRGFTRAELRDIIGYMKSIEASRPTRIIFVEIDEPDMSEEEAGRLMQELWPEPGGPPFMATFKREKTEE